MGPSDGTIMATIIRSHMPRNVAAAPVQPWPGIRIQAIDIVQPPGMGIPPDIDRAQATVAAALAANRTATVSARPRSRVGTRLSAPAPARSVRIAIVMAHPGLRELERILVAAPGREVEDVVGGVQEVDAAGVGRVRVEDVAPRVLVEGADAFAVGVLALDGRVVVARFS